MEGTVFFKINKYKVSAEDCYKEFQKLDELTPQKVVDLARDENNNLHNDFEWDNDIAGEKYRLIQAREMIQLLAFEPKESNHEPTRVYQISTEKTVYKPVEVIFKNDDEYQALLKRAYAELQAIRKRYSSIVELEQVFNAIDEL